MVGWIVLIVQALGYFIRLLNLLILVRCILSWMPAFYGKPVVRLIYRLTEPLLAPIRNIMQKSPLGGGMPVDFSPVIAMILLDVVYEVIVKLLFSLL
jgi:YggT family protein